MTEPLRSDSGVTFTVKELFDRLDGKLDTIDGKLDTKLDRAEFIGWTTKHEQVDDLHERRIGALETAEAARRGVSAWLSRWWVALTAGGAVAAAAAAFAAFLH